MVWPVPRIDDENEAFWTGGIDGYLEITRCAECGYYVHPPAPRCGRCYSDRVAPAPVSGRGRVYTFTVNEHAWMPGLEVPYVIAVVELEEGPKLTTNIVDIDPDDVVIGLPVQATFEDVDDVTLVNFRPE